MNSSRTIGWLTRATKKNTESPAIIFPANFFNLSPEMLIEILQYLDKQELLIFSMVCSAFHLFGVAENMLARAPWAQLNYANPLTGFHASPMVNAEIKMCPLPNGDMVCKKASGLMHFDFKTQSWQELQLNSWAEKLRNQEFINCYLFQNKFIVLNFDDGIAIWDRMTGRKVQFLSHRAERPSHQRFSTDIISCTNEIMTVSTIGLINVWEYDSKNYSSPFSLKSSAILPHKRGAATDVKFWVCKLDGMRGIFEDFTNGGLFVWDFETNQLVAEWSQPDLLRCLNRDPTSDFDAIDFDWFEPCLPGYVELEAFNQYGLKVRYLLNLNNTKSKPVYIGMADHVEGMDESISRPTNDGDFVVLEQSPFGLGCLIKSGWCEETRKFKSVYLLLLERFSWISQWGISPEGNVYICPSQFGEEREQTLYIWSKKTKEYTKLRVPLKRIDELHWLPSGDLLHFPRYFYPTENQPITIIDSKTGKTKHAISQVRFRSYAREGCLLADGSLAISWEALQRFGDEGYQSQYFAEVHRFGLWQKPEKNQLITQSSALPSM